jgi:L,D-transpeptidase ErfK/SrfK
MRRVSLFGCIAALMVSQSVLALSYPLPPEGSRLVGSTQVITVPHGSTLPLEAFAAQYDQGLSNMLEANPDADPFYPEAVHNSLSPAADPA